MDVMIPPSVYQNKPSTQVDKRKASEEQCHGPQLCIGGMMLAQLFIHHSANEWVYSSTQSVSLLSAQIKGNVIFLL